MMVETDTLQQRPGGSASKARRLTVALVGGVLLGLSGNAVKTLEEGLALRISSDDTTQGPTATVVCRVTSIGKQVAAEGAGTEVHSVVLSKNRLATTFECIGEGNEEVPRGLTNVCLKEKAATLQTCASGENAKQIALKQLLGAGSEAKWTGGPSTPANPPARRWSLQLQESDLPFTDKAFFVGCRKTSDEQPDVCTVDVTVKARPSSAINNVVTCAYGADSNPDILKVEVTKENNTLTLACGKDGSIAPAAYDTHYCADEKLTTCDKGYKDILPMFENTWWKKEGKDDAPVKLTIPEADFPTEEKNFFLGCFPKSTTGVQRAPQGAGAGASGDSVAGSICRVLATVKASSSTSATATARLLGAVSAAALLAVQFTSF